MYALMRDYVGLDCLTATAIAIRLYTINYFFWFSERTILGQLRQSVRFTDSQTGLCLLCWYYGTDHPIIGPLTYNILFLVTFGFWFAKSLGIDETLNLQLPPYFQHEVSRLYHYINHGLLFTILNTTQPTQYTLRLPFYNAPKYGENSETIVNVNNTLLFILFYIMLIYIPWYFFTGDKVYDV